MFFYIRQKSIEQTEKSQASINKSENSLLFFKKLSIKFLTLEELQSQYPEFQEKLKQEEVRLLIGFTNAILDNIHFPFYVIRNKNIKIFNRSLCFPFDDLFHKIEFYANILNIYKNGHIITIDMDLENDISSELSYIVPVLRLINYIILISYNNQNIVSFLKLINNLKGIYIDENTEEEQLNIAKFTKIFDQNFQNEETIVFNFIHKNYVNLDVFQSDVIKNTQNIVINILIDYDKYFYPEKVSKIINIELNINNIYNIFRISFNNNISEKYVIKSSGKFGDLYFYIIEKDSAIYPLKVINKSIVNQDVDKYISICLKYIKNLNNPIIKRNLDILDKKYENLKYYQQIQNNNHEIYKLN